MIDFTQPLPNFEPGSPEHNMLVGRAEEARKTLVKGLSDAGLGATVHQQGAFLFLNFDNPLHYATFVQELGVRGIVLPDNAAQPLAPSLDHTWDDLERTGDAFAAAASTVAQ